MKTYLSIAFSALILIGFTTETQSQNRWNNKKCAVVLTYDDALQVHLDNVLPVMDSLGLKGTFYLSGYFPGSRERIDDWKKAAQSGHELANHTLFHPCMGKGPGRSWVNRNHDLQYYTLQQLLDEIRMTNVFLQALDGKTKRTFAYPCGDIHVGDTTYVEAIKNDFVSARGVSPQMHSINDTDMFNVGSYMIQDKSGEELIALVKEAMKTNKLLVFLFHGVGGGHNINVDLKAHNELLYFLKANEKDIWVAPFLEISEFMQAHGQ